MKLRIRFVLILFMMLVHSCASVIFVNSMHVTQETGHKYETGMRITKDGQLVEGIIFDNISIGIAVWSNNNTIINCKFMYCSDEGILFIGSNNTVENCSFYKNGDGIELQRSCHNKISNCDFIENTHAGVDGIYEDNNHNFFFRCLFYKNPYGCIFRDSIDNYFPDCIFLKNNDADIRYFEG